MRLVRLDGFLSEIKISSGGVMCDECRLSRIVLHALHQSIDVYNKMNPELRLEGNKDFALEIVGLCFFQVLSLSNVDDKLVGKIISPLCRFVFESVGGSVDDIAISESIKVDFLRVCVYGWRKSGAADNLNRLLAICEDLSNREPVGYSGYVFELLKQIN